MGQPATRERLLSVRSNGRSGRGGVTEPALVSVSFVGSIGPSEASFAAMANDNHIAGLLAAVKRRG
jgi:hypothetical protein